MMLTTMSTTTPQLRMLCHVHSGSQLEGDKAHIRQEGNVRRLKDLYTVVTPGAVLVSVVPEIVLGISKFPSSKVEIEHAARGSMLFP